MPVKKAFRMWLAAAAVVAAAACAAIAEEPGAPEASARELVKRLGSDDWAEREKASAALFELGSGAAEALSEGLRFRDAEVFWRCLTALMALDGEVAKPVLEAARGDRSISARRRRRIVAAVKALDGPAFLGVHISDGSAPAEAEGGERRRGVNVVGVVPSSPAERSGIETGDVILAVAGTRVETAARLSREVQSRKPGAKVKVQVFRKGNVIEIEARLGVLDSAFKRN